MRAEPARPGPTGSSPPRTCDPRSPRVEAGAAHLAPCRGVCHGAYVTTCQRAPTAPPCSGPARGKRLPAAGSARPLRTRLESPGNDHPPARAVRLRETDLLGETDLRKDAETQDQDLRLGRWDLSPRWTVRVRALTHGQRPGGLRRGGVSGDRQQRRDDRRGDRRRRASLPLSRELTGDKKRRGLRRTDVRSRSRHGSRTRGPGPAESVVSRATFTLSRALTHPESRSGGGRHRPLRVS